MRLDRRDRLGCTNRVVDYRHRKTACKFKKSSFITRRIITSATRKRHEPAITFNLEQDRDQNARAHADMIRRMLGEAARIAEPAAPPLAGTMAILAGELSSTGEHAPHAIRPLYVRRTDAELARDARALR